MKRFGSGVKNTAISTVTRSKRTVDQDGDEIDLWVQKRKNMAAAMRFFKRLLKGQGCTPLKIVTDKLASYSAAKKN